jgi:hypothetical protein
MIDLVFPEFIRRLASETANFAVPEARRRMNSGKTKSSDMARAQDFDVAWLLCAVTSDAAKTNLRAPNPNQTLFKPHHLLHTLCNLVPKRALAPTKPRNLPSIRLFWASVLEAGVRMVK